MTYHVEPNTWDELFAKSYSVCKSSYKHFVAPLAAQYFIEGKMVGMGYTQWFIPIKEKWFVTISNFIAENGNPFRKILYLHQDDKLKQLNRCHSYYIDNEDELKGTGTITTFMLWEIIATLINHGENFDESNCIACRGNHPLQTHLIQLLL